MIDLNESVKTKNYQKKSSFFSHREDFIATSVVIDVVVAVVALHIDKNKYKLMFSITFDSIY